MEQKKQLVITISRQLGSGGSYIGQQLADKLGIFYADHEIILRAARDLSILEKDIETRDEEIISFWESFLKVSAFVPDLYMPPQEMAPTDRELFEVEAGIIEHIAKECPAVIIGRCGFHLLRDEPGSISIFLYASDDFRAERIAKLYHISKEVAKGKIAQSDRKRAYYCKTFTGKEWNDARNYDLCIDTGKVGVDTAVELILNYLKFV